MPFLSRICKMHTEVPILKRCCFCVPLRYGLITWAYIKLALGLFTGTQTIYEAVHYVTHPDYRTFASTYQLIFSIISMIMNNAITLTLLVAAHRKNVRLLRVCYYGGIMALIVDLVFIIIDYDLWWESWHHYPWLEMLTLAAFHALRMMIKAYVIILTRSELIKLQDRSQFRFVNHATADAFLENLTTRHEGTILTEAAGVGLDARGDDSCVVDDTRQKL